MLRQAQRRDGVARTQFQLEGKILLHDRIVFPEGKRLVIGFAILERIDIAADAGIDLRRLHVDETKSCLAAGAHRRDRHLESVMLLLLGEARLAPGGLLLLVEPARLFSLKDFPGHRLTIDPDRKF